MFENILNGKIQPLISLYLKSSVKSKILKVILNKEPITILGIQKDLERRKDKYNYRTIWQHIQSLEEDGAIISKKEEHEAGKPVKIYLNPYLKENKEEFKKFLEIALDKKKYAQFQKESEERKKEFLRELEKEQKD